MNKFKLATWNVTTLSMPQDKGEEGYYGKLDIFESQFRDQGYDIVALQETHVPGKRLEPIPGHTYDTYLSGTEVNTAGGGQRRAGVGLGPWRSIHRSGTQLVNELDG
jgi:exonuclease III